MPALHNEDVYIIVYTSLTLADTSTVALHLLIICSFQAQYEVAK
jgi:hypothetical protein